MRYFPITIVCLFCSMMFIACSQEESEQKTDQAVSGSGARVSHETPDPMAVPERITPKSENDWAAKVNNKNAEIIEVLNILNPVATYLTAAFDQYGDRLSRGAHDEWEDTVTQLNRANGIYDKAKAKIEQGGYDKSLFLQLEEAWQIYVKVGVAGVRTKTMVDFELQKMS